MLAAATKLYVSADVSCLLLATMLRFLELYLFAAAISISALFRDEATEAALLWPRVRLPFWDKI